MTETTALDPRTGPAAPHPSAVVAVASLGFFLITLDISIVNVSLAQMGRELGGGTVAQQWVIDGYTLPFAALLLLGGNLADRIGAKRVFAGAVVLFGLSSAACGAAPTSQLLIASRALQGAAAAAMLPASMSLIREALPDAARRSRALGVWAVGGAVAGLIGQPLGGVLTTADWRWVFLINVPVCLIMVGLLSRLGTSATRPAPFDHLGQVLALIALTALVFGLIHGGHHGFTTGQAILTLLVAAAALLAFVFVQSRVAHPMMPLELFTSPGLRIALPLGFAFMVGNFGNVFVISLYLQQGLRLTPAQAGLIFLPAAGFAVAGNLLSGPLTNRLGARTPVVTGLALMTAGLATLALVIPVDSPLLITIGLVLIGAGGSTAMPSVTSVVLDGVPAHQAGTASAVFNTFRQVGGAVAIAVFGALIADPARLVSGTQLSLTIAAVTVGLAGLAGLTIRPRATSAPSTG